MCETNTARQCALDQEAGTRRMLCVKAMMAAKLCVVELVGGFDLVWFGYLRMSSSRVCLRAHYDNRFEWIGTRNICQETHRYRYARAGTKLYNHEPPW